MRTIFTTMITVFFMSFAALIFPASAQGTSDNQAMQAQSVISDQLSAFIAGDGDRAFSHAAPTIKQRFQTPERFMDMVERGYGPIYRSSTYDFGRNSIQGNQVMQELILTDQKGNTWQSIYVLMKQADGSLKIMGVQMRRSENSIL
ncbi:MAG: DUF4864 domain-containing protein [Lentilitoribacter sp.]